MISEQPREVHIIMMGGRTEGEMSIASLDHDEWKGIRSKGKSRNKGTETGEPRGPL